MEDDNIVNHYFMLVICTPIATILLGMLTTWIRATYIRKIAGVKSLVEKNILRFEFIYSQLMH